MNDATETVPPQEVTHPMWCETYHRQELKRHFGVKTEPADGCEFSQHQGTEHVLMAGETMAWKFAARVTQDFEFDMGDGSLCLNEPRVALTIDDTESLIVPATGYLSASECRRLAEILEHLARDMDLYARRASR